MRSAFTLPVFLFSALLLANCKKEKNDAAPDLATAVKDGMLFNTWVIDDENNAHYTSTTQSVTFKDKNFPRFIIHPDYTYSFDYYDRTNHRVNETGSCEINVGQKELTFYPGRLPLQAGQYNDTASYLYFHYGFKVALLSEEELQLQNIVVKTTYITDAEGVQHAVHENVMETLYMEDDD
jgi:hypothetical protein